MIVFQAPIEFISLGLGQWKRLWHGGDAVPNVFHHLDAFRDAKFQHVGQGNFAHGIYEYHAISRETSWNKQGQNYPPDPTSFARARSRREASQASFGTKSG